MFGRLHAGQRRDAHSRHTAFFRAYFGRRQPPTDDLARRIPSRLLADTEPAAAAPEDDAPRLGRLDAREIDEDSFEAIPHTLLRRQWILPLRAPDGALDVASSRPLPSATRRLLRDATGRTPRTVLGGETEIRNALQQRLHGEDAGVIAATLPDELSARRVFTYRHWLLAAGIVVVVVAALIRWPLTAMIVLIASCFALYGVSTVYKLYLLVVSLWSRRHVPATYLADADLPSYTLLVPLYREAGVLPRLLGALRALEYPKDRIEAFLLLEEDDLETRRAVEDMELPPWAHALVVPEGTPKGKPRALNYGLSYASGELLVIFDAEDVPDPWQLREAAGAFATAGAEVACVQCSLAFYNGRQNALTHLFTVEYATWFELVLPALSASGVPLPLGGTSNHFRTEVLRALGGWDAFNVTEDADLGMRFARAGYRTVTADSDTLEEANSRLWNWVRQRTRWNKGHMVTYVVHMRHPVQLLREIGWHGFLSWQLVVGGSVLTQLLNPLFWVLLILWYGTSWEALRPLFPLPLLYTGNLLVFGSTSAYVVFGALACLRNRHYYAAPYALLLPAYWVLQSFAAYRALFQLVSNPHQWEKTEHNLTTEAALRKSGWLGAPLPATDLTDEAA